MTQDTEPQPHFARTHCDALDCDATGEGDFLACDDLDALDALRCHLNDHGWDCSTAGDFCPEHTR